MAVPRPDPVQRRRRPCGIALDPAAGKIYWANWDTGEIRVANLDGTGTPRPCSPRQGTTSAASRSIPRPARSTGPTSAPTRSGSEPEWHGRLDPVHRPGRKRPERRSDRPREQQDLLDEPVLRRGSGREPGRLGTASDAVWRREDNPIRVAADPAGGKIYWTDLIAGPVRVGPLGGSTVGPHRPSLTAVA